LTKVKAVYLDTLLHLLSLGAKDTPVYISTTELGKRLGRSQQAASRHLLELERAGLLSREVISGRVGLRLTPKGCDALYSIYVQMKASFDSTPHLELSGQVFTGLGEGAYYMSIRGYRRQFVRKLGFDPYLGTLNIRLSSAKDIATRNELEHLPGIWIEGFEDGSRSYGPVKSFRAKLNNSLDGALLLIERTHHDKSVIEFIAPVNAREMLGLTDGQVVTVSVLT